MKQQAESETDTTNKKEDSVSFDEVFNLLKEISTKLPGVECELNPVNYWLKTLKPDDVVLEYKVVAHTKNGELFNVSGVSNLPRIFCESMLPESPEHFETTFNSSITRPVLNAFLKIVSDKVMEFKRTSTSMTLAMPNDSMAQDHNNAFLSDS